jgi:hypothetical protein
MYELDLQKVDSKMLKAYMAATKTIAKTTEVEQYMVKMQVDMNILQNENAKQTYKTSAQGRSNKTSDEKGVDD